MNNFGPPPLNKIFCNQISPTATAVATSVVAVDFAVAAVVEKVLDCFEGFEDGAEKNDSKTGAQFYVFSCSF